MEKPLIFGHRGASIEEPENTMIAFKKAFRLNADGIEFDIRSCASGELIVIHDESIDRTSNGSGKVKEMTLEELARFTYGKEERIPTLEEVLKKFGNQFWLNIEIKEEGIEKQVIDLLTDNSINQKIIISSFYTTVITNLKEHTEEIDIAYLYDFPLNDLSELVQEFTLRSIHPGVKNITRKLIEDAHNKNLQVRGWTIDDSKRAAELVKWKIDGIITNDISKIKQALQPKSS